jgi:spermidine synthase
MANRFYEKTPPRRGFLLSDFLRQLTSYVWPLSEHRMASAHNPLLEVVRYRGKLLLNSASANYSYGALQTVFEKAFAESKLIISPTAKVLLLGLGGGCVLEVLQKKYKFCGAATAIEIDPVVIDLYRKFFKPYPGIEILNDDARTRLSQLNNDEYHLIVCDLFTDLTHESFIFEKCFLAELSKKLTRDGCLFINSIWQEKAWSAHSAAVISTISEIFRKVELKKYQENNLVFVCKKSD